MTVYKNSIYDLSHRIYSEGRDISYILLDEEIVEKDGYKIQGKELLSYTGDEEEVRLPEGIYSIGEGAFAHATQIKKLYLPKDLVLVAKDAFKPLVNLQELYVLGRYSRIFDGVSLTESMQQLLVFMRSGSCSDSEYEKACENRSCFAEKVFRFYIDYYIDPEGVLRDSEEEEEIALIDKEKVMGKRGFTVDDFRGNVQLPEGITSVGTVMRGMWISKIQLPNSMKIIEDRAFCNSDLKEIILPEGLESIGNGAFTGTRLKKITIPKNVKYIGCGAFTWCNKLRKVTCYAETLEIGTRPFSYFKKLTIKCVREGDFSGVWLEALKMSVKDYDIKVPDIREIPSVVEETDMN